jgi:hypothetical protein
MLPRDADHEYLGAVVASREEGEALGSMIRDKIKGSKPAVVCFAPKRPLRRLRFKTR